MALLDSFYQEFDIRFHSLLKQDGSKLMSAVINDNIVGETKTYRQSNVVAHFVEDPFEPTKWPSATNSKRLLPPPRAMSCSIMIDKFDFIKQGAQDMGRLVESAANSCGIFIDKIILSGIGGLAKTGDGDVALPASQTIAYDDMSLGEEDEPEQVRFGLSTSKISKAVAMLRKKFNSGPLICVANNDALSMLNYARSNFNTIQSFAGVDVFIIPCERWKHL